MGPISYSDVVDQTRDLDRLPDDEIDGRTVNAIPRFGLAGGDAIRATGGMLATRNSSKRLPTRSRMRISRCSSTRRHLRPRRFTMAMTMEIDGVETTTDITMDYTEYNVDVDIPEPPDDAEEIDIPIPTP